MVDKALSEKTTSDRTGRGGMLTQPLRHRGEAGLTHEETGETGQSPQPIGRSRRQVGRLLLVDRREYGRGRVSAACPGVSLAEQRAAQCERHAEQLQRRERLAERGPADDRGGQRAEQGQEGGRRGGKAGDATEPDPVGDGG